MGSCEHPSKAERTVAPCLFMDDQDGENTPKRLVGVSTKTTRRRPTLLSVSKTRRPAHERGVRRRHHYVLKAASISLTRCKGRDCERESFVAPHVLLSSKSRQQQQQQPLKKVAQRFDHKSFRAKLDTFSAGFGSPQDPLTICTEVYRTPFLQEGTTTTTAHPVL
jgi:hypothetical protein